MVSRQVAIARIDRVVSEHRTGQLRKGLRNGDERPCRCAFDRRGVWRIEVRRLRPGLNRQNEADECARRGGSLLAASMGRSRALLEIPKGSQLVLGRHRRLADVARESDIPPGGRLHIGPGHARMQMRDDKLL